MSDTSRAPAPARLARLARSPWPGAVAVGLVALAAFGYDLPAEPHFVDESAYYSQSYFAGLFVLGRWSDPEWLEYPAYDLPPLPKYLIGTALGLGGYPFPGPAEARKWYENTALRFDPPGGGGLVTARVPFVVVGAIGCVAVYGLGVLAGGRRVGVVAALLLVANPLYRLLARRAMSDVPCEAFLDVGLLCALWAWKHALGAGSGGRVWPGAVAAGLGAGLALLCKMNGILFVLVVTFWTILGVVRTPSVARKWLVVGVTLQAAIVACATFVALDPYLTARPARAFSPAVAEVRSMNLLERTRLMFRLRFRVSAGQQHMFPHNALPTRGAKAAVVAVQGFGRFGPFGPSHSDSTRRFDAAQDWGAVVWLPGVAAGAVWAWRKGKAQAKSGGPPTAWAVLVQFGVALAVVTAYIPMAWDRYYLPLQAPAALLAAGALVGAAEWLFPRLRPEIPEGARA